MNRSIARTILHVAILLLCAGLLATAGCDGTGLASCNGSGSGGSSVDSGPSPGTLLIEIGPEAIYVDNEQVVALERGRVSADDMRDGAAGYYVIPLHEALEARIAASLAERDAGEPIERVRVAAHPLTASRVYSAVIYTTDQAGLGREQPFEWRVCPAPDCSPAAHAGSSVVEFTKPVPHTHNHEPIEDDENPLRLRLRPGKRGITVAGAGTVIPPEHHCPVPGPTICLKDLIFDVEATLEASRKALYDGGTEETAMKHYRRVLAGYDYRRLYNLAVEIKENYPDVSKFEIEIFDTDPDLPMGLYREVVEHLHFRLPEPKYDTDEAYREARERLDDDAEPLFAEVCPPMMDWCWEHLKRKEKEHEVDDRSPESGEAPSISD